MHLIWTLIVGAIIGAIAGAITSRGASMGWIANIVAGLVGSWLGQMILGDWGPSPADGIDTINYRCDYRCVSGVMDFCKS